MHRVDQRFVGQGLWNSAAPPMTLQAAMGRAQVMQDSAFADDARIVNIQAAQGAPAPAETHLVDRRV